MSQIWNSLALSLATGTWGQNASDRFDTLRTLNAGAAAPGSPVAHMLWLDTSGTPVLVLKIRNEANSAWVTLLTDVAGSGGGALLLSGGTMAGILNLGGFRIENVGNANSTDDAINKGQADGRILTLPVPLGTISASDNKYLLAPGAVDSTIVDVTIVSELGVASSGVDYWTFNVRNLTDGVNLRSAAKSTNGAAITADTAYALGLDQNLSGITAHDVLQLQMVKGGAAANLQEAIALVHYKVTTP